MYLVAFPLFVIAKGDISRYQFGRCGGKVGGPGASEARYKGPEGLRICRLTGCKAQTRFIQTLALYVGRKRFFCRCRLAFQDYQKGPVAGNCYCWSKPRGFITTNYWYLNWSQYMSYNTVTTAWIQALNTPTKSSISMLFIKFNINSCHRNLRWTSECWRRSVWLELSPVEYSTYKSGRKVQI